MEFSYKAQVMVALVCPNQLLSVLGAPNCLQTMQGHFARLPQVSWKSYLRGAGLLRELREKACLHRSSKRPLKAPLCGPLRRKAPRRPSWSLLFPSSTSSKVRETANVEDSNSVHGFGYVSATSVTSQLLNLSYLRTPKVSMTTSSNAAAQKPLQVLGLKALWLPSCSTDLRQHREQRAAKDAIRAGVLLQEYGDQDMSMLAGTQLFS